MSKQSRRQRKKNKQKIRRQHSSSVAEPTPLLQGHLLQGSDEKKQGSDQVEKTHERLEGTEEVDDLELIHASLEKSLEKGDFQAAHEQLSNVNDTLIYQDLRLQKIANTLKTDPVEIYVAIGLFILWLILALRTI